MKLIVTVAIFLFLFSSCSSSDDVEIYFDSTFVAHVTIKDRVYAIDRFISADELPFEYQFEPDGDLNIIYDGRSYEFDNPFDLDGRRTGTSTVNKNKKSIVKSVKESSPFQKTSEKAKNR